MASSCQKLRRRDFYTSTIAGQNVHLQIQKYLRFRGSQINSVSRNLISETYCAYASFKVEKQGRSNSEIVTLLKKIIEGRDRVLLKVLDLEGVYKPQLPKKLGELRNLKYLGLRWTGLDSCPASIGDLPCLETIDLKYTNITTLPSSVWKAKKLSPYE